MDMLYIYLLYCARTCSVRLAPTAVLPAARYQFCLQFLIYNKNTNNNNNDIYSAVIVAEPLWEFTRFMWSWWWIQKWHQVAADLWTKPTGLSRRPIYRQPVNCIHHCHLLSLLSPKADTHFTIPRRVEGWVDLDGWLYTQMVYLPTSSHPSQ